jgi:hypothetical protein
MPGPQGPTIWLNHSARRRCSLIFLSSRLRVATLIFTSQKARDLPVSARNSEIIQNSAPKPAP